MRTALFFTFMFIAGCGGNWSNQDLEFAAALPSRSDLGSKLPATASTAQPLMRRDGLNAGEPSQAYLDTKKAVTDFNGLLDFFLGALDTVRTRPPSSRSPNARTWGPFTARDAPGYQVQVTMTLTGSDPRDTWAWQVQARQFGEAEFFDLVRGQFQSSAETVRRGMGSIEIPVKDFRDRIKLEPPFQQLDRIVIGYQTTVFHRTPR